MVALHKHCVWLQACEAVNVSPVQFTRWLVGLGGWIFGHTCHQAEWISFSAALQVKDWSLCTYRGWSQGSLVYLEPLCVCQCLWILLTFLPFGCKLKRESHLQMNTSPGWHRHVRVFTAWLAVRTSSPVRLCSWAGCLLWIFFFSRGNWQGNVPWLIPAAGLGVLISRWFLSVLVEAEASEGWICCVFAFTSWAIRKISNHDLLLLSWADVIWAEVMSEGWQRTHRMTCELQKPCVNRISSDRCPESTDLTSAGLPAASCPPSHDPTELHWPHGYYKLKGLLTPSMKYHCWLVASMNR